MSRKRALAPLAAALLCLAAVGCTVMQDEREVTTSSDEAYQAYREGMRQLYRGEAQQARVHLDKAVEADPDFGMAHMALARTLRGLGDSVGSASHLARAVMLMPDLPEDEQLQIKIMRAYLDFQIEEGARLAAELAEKYPDHPEGIIAKAEQAWWNMDYDEAARQYNRVLAADPERVDVHNSLGSIALTKGDFEEAIASFQRYIFYAPGLPAPVDKLGKAYLECGRYEEAIKQFNQALTLDPAYLSAGKSLSVALTAIGRIQNARNVLDEMEPVFKDRSQEKERRVLLMDIAYETRDWDELLRLSMESEVPDEIDPEHINYPLQVLVFRTVAQLETGQEAAAAQSASELLNHLEMIKTRIPESPVASGRFKLLDAYLRSRFARAKGRPAEGIERLTKAMDECGFGEHHLYMMRLELAEAHFENGDSEMALQVATRALEVIPTQPALNLLAAKSLVKLNREAEAAAFLRRYLEVTRLADRQHPDVTEARRLAARLVPGE